MECRRVLVVDGDKGTAQVIRGHLESLGYEILEAYDGASALQTARDDRPDLVILELALPDQDGLEVIRAIRGDAHLRNLPVIVLSARETESDRVLGLEAGADDFLAKPINLRELGARVRVVLRRCYREATQETATATPATSQPDREDEKMSNTTPGQTDPVIEIENVTKVYQMGEVQVHALRGVSLTVQQGDYIAIMGASGSGKSTLMNVIGLLDRPTSGNYRIRGEETSQLSKNRLADLRNHEIGFVFQQFNLLPRVSARRQVGLPLFYAGTSTHQTREMETEALALVGLAERANHRPDELSGGQQQRVAIARALVNRPSLLLADEPTGALDSKTGAEVLDLIDRLHSQGLTVIMVTHDRTVAKRAERVIVLSDGEIISDEKNGKNLLKREMEAIHESH
jgi:putative ABC transport system ATP-binding protein